MNQPKRAAALARFLRMRPLCDGIRTSSEIAEILDENVKYIQKMMLKYNLPRRVKCVVPPERNGFYVCGRSIDQDGYASVICPPEYREMATKNGRVLEHRLVKAREIGRNLHPLEVVDHIDGIRLHNSPSNLRLFASNAEHLRATLTDSVPRWSEAGKVALDLTRRRSADYQPVDIHRMRVVSGDERLLTLIRTALLFGRDSPFLLGSCPHFEKAGIVDFSRSNLEREWAAIDRKYA